MHGLQAAAEAEEALRKVLADARDYSSKHSPGNSIAMATSARNLDLMLRHQGNTDPKQQQLEAITRAMQQFNPAVCYHQQQTSQVACTAIRWGSDVNQINTSDMDYTCFHYAAYYNEPFMCGWLAHHGADIFAVDRNQKTALHIATKYASVETIRCLLMLGLDTQAKDKYGRTSLDLLTDHRSAAKELDLQKFSVARKIFDLWNHVPRSRISIGGISVETVDLQALEERHDRLHSVSVDDRDVEQDGIINLDDDRDNSVDRTDSIFDQIGILDQVGAFGTALQLFRDAAHN